MVLPAQLDTDPAAVGGAAWPLATAREEGVDAGGQGDVAELAHQTVAAHRSQADAAGVKLVLSAPDPAVPAQSPAR